MEWVMSGIGPKELDIRRSAFAQGGILFDANSLPQAVPAMLEPDHWPGAVPLDGRGGRGVPWLVRGDFGEAVLRHYRRGGLVGRVISDHYLYSGQRGYAACASSNCWRSCGAGSAGAASAAGGLAARGCSTAPI